MKKQLFTTALFVIFIPVILLAQRDIAVLSIPGPPQTGCKYSNNENLNLEVANVGTQAVGHFTFGYSINDQAPVYITILLFVPIPPGDTFNFPVAQNVDLSDGYLQHIKAWCDITGDSIQDNDTAETTLYSFTAHDLTQSQYELSFENAAADSSRFAWTFTDGDSDQVVAEISDLNARTGTQSILIEGWGDWAISPCLELEASKAYMLEFYATQQFLAALPDIITVSLGSSNDIQSMTTQLLPPTWVIDTFGTGAFTKYCLPIQVPSSGIYHVGIQYLIGHGVFIDDFSVSIDTITSCFAPVMLQTTVVNSSTVTLNWQSQASANSYIVSGKEAGSTNYVNISVPGTTLTVTGLSKSVSYLWKVASVCASDTVFSFEEKFNIGDTLACDPPVSILTTQIASASALLVWSFVSKAEAYQILGRKLGTGSIVKINVPASSNSYLATGLSPNTTYEWTVRTICDTTNGVLSGVNLVTAFTTLPSVNEKESASNIRIKPNPGDGYFYVEGLGEEDDVKITVFDASGKEVYSMFAEKSLSNVPVNVEFLSSGTYFMVIRSKIRSEFRRIVISN